MLVFGDAVRHETVAEKLAHIRRFLTAATGALPGIVRHGYLTAALIEAGELAQGLADFEDGTEIARDASSSRAMEAMALTRALALEAGRSWSGEGEPAFTGLSELERLEGEDGARVLRIKQPEGFGFYCVYPEAFYQAALPLRGRNVRAVGIRSIGTTLSAMVSAALDGPCPITVRPTGHPYSRTLSVADGAAGILVPDARAEYAIVDEGPGASGSSVLAVAKALESAGVGRERLHLFPSHGNGPGAAASPQAREFWRLAPTHLVTFDDLVLRSTDPSRRLETWVLDLVGPAVSPLLDISAGAWRAVRYRSEHDWPPVLAWQERRKFLIETASGSWLLRFAGLGRVGLEKFKRASRLSAAGFVPEVLGYRHGFLVERWHGGASVPTLSGAARPEFLNHLGAYLGFRAREFRSSVGRGATASELWRMARVNVEEGLGPDAARTLDAWRPALPRFDALAEPIETDSRLHLWEWLRLADGTILKTDGLDHHAAHDLVGSQDLAWDVAGAGVEFNLSEAELAALTGAVQAESGRAIDLQYLAFLRICYPAFQLGYYEGAVAAGAGQQGETAGAKTAVRRYAGALRPALERTFDLR